MPKVVLLFGPTGVGKTRLLEDLFAGFSEVISADALQVYRDMDVGTAKPNSHTLKRIPHHLIDIIGFTEAFNVGEFCHRTDDAITGILNRGNLPVISGGTAYYMKLWLTGLPQTPASDPKVREKIESRWMLSTDDEIRRELEKIDPESASRIGKRDRYRMLRALEVYEQSGHPLSRFRVPQDPRTDYRILSIGLRRERQDLISRIEHRVDLMLEAGLENEVRRLRAQGAEAEHPGMKGIGYREWFGSPENPNPGVEEVRELIIRNTRRYAKRQMTFFASLPNVRWIDLNDDDNGVAPVSVLLSEFGVT